MVTVTPDYDDFWYETNTHQTRMKVERWFSRITQFLRWWMPTYRHLVVTPPRLRVSPSLMWQKQIPTQTLPRKRYMSKLPMNFWTPRASFFGPTSSSLIITVAYGQQDGWRKRWLG